MSPINSNISHSFATATTFPKIVTNGLVLNYDAGQQNSYSGSGTTWTDLSGRGNNGTLTNGPTYNSADGGFIVFDGTNDFVLRTTSNGFGTANLPPAASMEIWANVTRKGGGSFAYHNLAGFRNNSNFDFYFLLLDNSGATVLTEARIRTSTTVTGIYADFPVSYFGNWTHIVFTANVNRTDLYLNGVLVGSDTSLAGSFPATSGNFNVGKSPPVAAGGGQSWQTKGNISSVRFYNRALTVTEIRQNFNALKGRFGGFGPVSWNYEDNAALPQGKTTDVVSFTISTNVTSFSSSGTLPTGTSLSLNGGTLTLSGTLAQFGYAAHSIGEGASYTLSAADFGATKTFTIIANGETRTFTHRQVGNLLISKTFESYGTPNNVNFVSLAAQQNDATTNPSFTTGGCAAVGQVLSGGGVASVTMNANNGTYGDPCNGVAKKLNVSYTI
jgi:hypothetical protein